MKFLLIFFLGLSPFPAAMADDADDNEATEKSGLFVEPMLTVSRQDSEIKTSQITPFDDTNGTTTAYGVGAKLGMHVTDAVFLGVDGRYSRATIDDSSYGDADGNAYNLGVTAGVQMPIVGLRVFGTYVPWGEFDPDSGAQGFDLRMKKAQGFRVGAGFRVAIVSINLEYERLKYDETEIQSIGALTGGTTDVDTETDGWILSLSFPLAL